MTCRTRLSSRLESGSGKDMGLDKSQVQIKCAPVINTCGKGNYLILIFYMAYLKARDNLNQMIRKTRK